VFKRAAGICLPAETGKIRVIRLHYTGMLPFFGVNFFQNLTADLFQCCSCFFLPASPQQLPFIRFS
jgi:hypothetical protein